MSDVNTGHAITQSMLGNADTCMRGFQYAMQRPAWVKQVGGADRAVGTGYHAALASYYEERITNPSALPDVAKMIAEGQRIFEVSTTIDLYDNTPIEQFKWSDRVPNQPEAFALIDQMVTAYVKEGWWLGLEHEIVAVELNERFTDPTTGRTFKLGADLVSRLGTTVRLTDHKTSGKAWPQGKESPRKQNQSALYTWAARQKWGDANRIEFAFDIIMFPGARTPVRFERRITVPTPEHEHAVISKALDLMNLYETVVVGQGRDLPANPASTLCNPKWCDYWDGCPHGAALDGTRDVLVISSSIVPLPSPAKPATTTVAVAPDEGDVLPDVDALRARYMGLEPAMKLWVDAMRAQAVEGRVDFHLAGNYTQRRASIMDGLTALAVADACDDDTLRALVRFVTADDACQWPTTPAGVAVGSLGATQAAAFADACRLFVGFGLALAFDDHGAKVVTVD